MTKESLHMRPGTHNLIATREIGFRRNDRKPVNVEYPG